MDSVNCPFCGKEYGDLWELFLHDEGDGAESTIECYECGKEYKIIMHVSIDYSTDPDSEYEDYLNRHPKIKEELQASKDRIKAMIEGDRKLTGDRV